MKNLVVHVPHASTYIPDDVWPEFLVAHDLVAQEAEVSADLFTDLIAREAWPHAEILEASVSRIVVDVERYDDDGLEEMAQVGRGVIYTHDHRQFRIRRDVSAPRRNELLAQFYTPHWARLRAAALGVTLIDLHTYPMDPWPIERHAGGWRPEIDLGYTSELTPRNWVEDMTRHFNDLDFEVGHNTPYSGVIDAGAKSAVMIEIRRDVLGTPRNSPKWARLMQALKSMPLME